MNEYSGTLTVMLQVIIVYMRVCTRVCTRVCMDADDDVFFISSTAEEDC